MIGILAAITNNVIASYSLGIDFSNTHNVAGSGDETNFNQLGGQGALTIAAGSVIDATGSVIPSVAMSIISGGEMGNNTIGYGDAGIGDYTGTPFSDLSFNDGIYGGATMDLTISGLDDALTYDVLLAATGPASQNNAVSFVIDGVTINSTYNAIRAATLTPMSWTGVSADGSGNLLIDNVSSVTIGLAAIHITAVPEPATVALLSLGSLALFRRRRR